MNILKRLKTLIEGQDRKKLIENTVIVIIIGIILLIASTTIFQKKPVNSQSGKENAAAAANTGTVKAVSGNETEERLKLLLAQVRGVGRVDVMVTYTSSSETIPAYDIKKSRNTTQEKDNQGGTRNISEEQYDSTLVYENASDGSKKPVVLKKVEPEVKGVLVVAEGADSAEVRERIRDSVMVLLDVPAHKVQVVQRKK